MADLLDAKGRPMRSSDTKRLPSSDEEVRRLVKLGVERTADGGLKIPMEVVTALRADRIRKATVTKVPSTPRHMMREAGGLGVRKGAGRWDVLTIDALRRVRETVPLIQAIHQARHYQVRRLSRKWNGRRGEVGWRVVHRDHTDYGQTPPEGFQRYIDRMETIIERPAPGRCEHTSGLLSPLWEDLATINAPTAEVLYSAQWQDRVVGIRPIDGGIIWPTLMFVERWVRDNPTWSHEHDLQQFTDEQLLELLSEAVKQDLTVGNYCLVRDGQIEAVFNTRTILRAPIVNRTDIRFAGYYPSHVEQSAEMLLAFLNTWQYNANYFTRGMLAEFALGITGDVHDDDIQAFVNMLVEATAGVERAWQPPVIPLPMEGAVQKIDLKQSNRDMMYEVWTSLVVALATACYRMDPSTINARPWNAGSSSGLSEGNRNQEIANAKEEGLQGDMEHLIQGVLNPLARRCHPDLRVIIETGDFDPKKEAEIADIQIRTNRSVNETRVERGDRPIGCYLPAREWDEASDEEQQKHWDNPWNIPANQTVIGRINMQDMQDQKMPEGMPEGDGFGEPAGADDGFGEQGPDDGPSPFGQPEPEPGGMPGAPGGMPGAPGGGGVPSPMEKGRAAPTTLHRQRDGLTIIVTD